MIYEKHRFQETYRNLYFLDSIHVRTKQSLSFQKTKKKHFQDVARQSKTTIFVPLNFEVKCRFL